MENSDWGRGHAVILNYLSIVLFVDTDKGMKNLKYYYSTGNDLKIYSVVMPYSDN